MKINVKHVAKLANLQIDPKDESKFEKQLSDILGYVDKLKEADTEGVAITSQVTGFENVTRKDTSSQSLTQEEALSGSKSTENGMFKVKLILED